LLFHHSIFFYLIVYSKIRKMILILKILLSLQKLKHQTQTEKIKIMRKLLFALTAIAVLLACGSVSAQKTVDWKKPVCKIYQNGDTAEVWHYEYDGDRLVSFTHSYDDCTDYCLVNVHHDVVSLASDQLDYEAVFQYTYNDNGQRLTMNDGYRTLYYKYDEQGRISEVTDGEDVVESYTYDDSRKICTKMAMGDCSYLDYEGKPMYCEIEGFDGLVIEYVYVGNCQIVTEIQSSDEGESVTTEYKVYYLER